MLNLHPDILNISQGLLSFNDKNLSLLYSIGKCTLQDLMNFKFDNKIPWELNDLKYLTYALINMAYKMKECDNYHSDEKPSNIVIAQQSGFLNLNKLFIYLIDFGNSTFCFDQLPLGFTPFYAPYDTIL